MGIVLGRSTRYLPILYVVVALFVILQSPSGKAQQTRLLVGDAGKDGILVYDGGTGAFLDGWGLSPTGGLDGPNGLVFGPDGYLYVSSRSTHSILRYDGRTGTFRGAFVSTGSGGLFSPESLTFSPDEHLYVSSSFTDCILRYDGQTGAFIDAFVERGSGGLDGLEGMAFGPDGHLYVSNYVSNSDIGNILRYDGQTGTFIDVFVADGSDGLGIPQDLTFGPDGHLYITGRSHDSIRRYDGQTGAFIDVFVERGSGGLGVPQDLTFGPDGHLYITDRLDDSIRRYDGQTGAFIDAFVSTGRRELNLTFGPEGNLYVSSGETDSIRRYDGQTGVFIDAFVSTGSDDLNNPQGLTLGPDGHLYVSSGETDSILRYDGQTGVFIDAFVSTGSGGLDYPSGLTFGPDDHLYVSSSFTDSILRYDGRTGAFLNAFVPSGSGGLNSPSGLIFGPDGHLYVSGGTFNIDGSSVWHIIRYDGATGTFLNTLVLRSGSFLVRLPDLTFGPDGYLYVSSGGFSSSEVLRYDGHTGAFVDAFVSAGNGGLDSPEGLTFGPDGYLYVSSRRTHSILRYDGETGAFLDTFVSFDQGGLTFPTGLVFQTLEQPSLPLTVLKDGDGSGDVFSSPSGVDCGDTCTGEFLDSTEITLTAVPAAEQVFVGWQGGGCTGTGPCTVTLTQPLTLTATFEPQPSIGQFLLAIVRQGDGSGNVTSDSGQIDCGAVCTAEYAAGTSDTLRATAAADSVFVGWGGEGCSGIAPCTLTIDQPRTLTAVFEPLPEPDTFPLFVSKIGTGTGRVTSNSGTIDCGSTCGAELTNGTSVTLSATPDPHSTFMGWQGGGCAGMAACTFTMTQEQSITARFDRNPMPKTLTVQKRGTGRGTVSSNPAGIRCGVECEVEFADNEVVTLTVEPASDSTFVGWVGGLCSGTAPCTVTMNDNREITVLINSVESPSDEGDDGGL